MGRGCIISYGTLERSLLLLAVHQGSPTTHSEAAPGAGLAAGSHNGQCRENTPSFSRSLGNSHLLASYGSRSQCSSMGTSSGSMMIDKYPVFMSPPLAWKMALVVKCIGFLVEMCKVPVCHSEVFCCFPEMPGYHSPTQCHWEFDHH